MGIPALLFVAVALLAGNHVTEGAPRKGAPEISSTVATFYNSDLNVGSTCGFSIKKAKAFGGKKLQFVVTHYWLGGEGGVRSYCYRTDANSACQAFTPAAIAKFQAGLTACLKYAAQNGFTTILVTPHLDDGTTANLWRNFLKLNPTTKIGGYSYYDVLLKPIAAALGAVKAKNPNFVGMLELQGEMGAALFTAPGAYTPLVPLLKAQIGRGAKIGVGLNWNAVLGRVPAGRVPKAAVQRLFNTVDFISISAYAPVPANFGPKDLQASVLTVQKDLAGVINLAALQKAGKQLIYSEWGVGGARGDGVTPVGDVPELAKRLYYGMYFPFSPRRNPFPEGSAKQAWLVKYFATTSAWLGAGTGPTYKIAGLFLWNLNSYDVQGVAPYTYVYADGYRGNGYVQPKVNAIIRRHNAAVN